MTNENETIEGKTSTEQGGAPVAATLNFDAMLKAIAGSAGIDQGVLTAMLAEAKSKADAGNARKNACKLIEDCLFDEELIEEAFCRFGEGVHVLTVSFTVSKVETEKDGVVTITPKIGKVECVFGGKAAVSAPATGNGTPRTRTKHATFGLSKKNDPVTYYKVERVLYDSYRANSNCFPKALVAMATGLYPITLGQQNEITKAEGVPNWLARMGGQSA